jgi:hypothetical protein
MHSEDNRNHGDHCIITINRLFTSVINYYQLPLYICCTLIQERALLAVHSSASFPNRLDLTFGSRRKLLLLQISMLCLHRVTITFTLRSFFKNPGFAERTNDNMIWSSSFPIFILSIQQVVEYERLHLGKSLR